MSNIPRNLRNNLINYGFFVSEYPDSPRDNQRFKQDMLKYVQRGGNSNYNKGSLASINSINPSLSLQIKKARYDDLFEDFVKSGYIDLDEIDSQEDLREELEKALSNNPAFSEFKGKTPRRFKSMANQFFRGMKESAGGKKFTSRRRTAVIINNDNFNSFESRVNQRQREKFKKLVNNNNAINIFNKKTKGQQVIYKDPMGRFRDINTGRYAPKPTQLTFR